MHQNTPVNKLKVSTTREVKNKSEVKFLKKYRLHAAQPGATDIVLLSREESGGG